MYKVIDNFLPNIYANILEEMVKSEVAWNCLQNKTGVTEENSKNLKYYKTPGADYSGLQYGFTHSALDKLGNRSIFFEKILPMLYFVEEKANIEVKEISRIRLGLSVSTGKEVQHYPHVDEYEPHYVLLYYVNDSDGDTFMLNEMYQEGVNPKDFTVKERVTPKKNRAVIFDGLRYHHSSNPVNNSLRFVVNINFT